jgi:hypothetical protein
MEHEHLDDAALERLIALDRNEDQNRELFHLLAVCPRCQEAGGWLLDLHRKGALPTRFGPVDAALAHSRAVAAWLLFHRAAVRETVTVELTREVAASLHQVRTGA